jgi:hypothetical protein
MQTQRDLWLDPELDATQTGIEPKYSVLILHRLMLNVLILCSIGAIILVFQSF